MEKKSSDDDREMFEAEFTSGDEVEVVPISERPDSFDCNCGFVFSYVKKKPYRRVGKLRMRKKIGIWRRMWAQRE